MESNKIKIVSLGVLLYWWCFTFSACQAVYNNSSDTDNVGMIDKTQVNSHPQWIAKKKRLSLKEIPQTIYFVDRGFGWIGTVDGLFRTTDLGETWEKSDIPVRAGETIAGINFIDHFRGVVALENRNLKPGHPESVLLQELRLLRTNDSGITWTESLAIKGVEFFSLVNDGMQYWVGGVKNESLAPLCFDPLVLSGELDGSGWHEDSPLSGAGNDRARCSNQAAVRFSQSGGSAVQVLITDGIIYEKAADSGYGWKKVFAYDLGLRNWMTGAFGQNGSSKFWVIEGMDNEHGMRGRIISDLGNGQVNANVISDFDFADASPVSDNQLLIVGSKLSLKFDKKTKRDIQSRNGAILLTDGAGNTYQEIFTDSDESKFVAISPIGPQRNIFWVLGQNGSVVELSDGS